MNKVWENKYSMVQAVLKLSKKYAALIAGIPALKRAFDVLGGLAEQIGLKSVEFKEGTKGRADTKSQAEERLVDVVLTVANAMWSIAAEKEDEEMKARFEVNYSMLTRMRDTDLETKATGIYTEALTHLTELEENDIKQADFDEMDAAIKSFHEALGSSEAAPAEKGTAYDDLTVLFAKVDAQLKIIDKRMDAIYRKSPQYYEEHFLARQIRNAGLRHRGSGNGPQADNPGAEPPPPSS